MFEQIVNLITRGVVALETIAKHYETVGAAVDPKANGTAKKGKAKPDTEVEDDDQDEVEDTPKAKKVVAKETKSKGKAKKEVVEDDDEDEAEDENRRRVKKHQRKAKVRKMPIRWRRCATRSNSMPRLSQAVMMTMRTTNLTTCWNRSRSNQSLNWKTTTWQTSTQNLKK